MTDTDTATLGEQAYQTMRSMIARGELPAGQWLRKRRLASRLQMSATPIVEALRRLEHEGLVQTESPWGARVRKFRVSEIEELAGMRVMLESLVARKAAERLNSVQVASLREMAVQVDVIDRQSSDPEQSRALLNRPEAFELDQRFHLSLALEASLPLVHREIERLQILKATCRVYCMPTTPTRVTHVQLIDAIATGDGEFAERMMRQHIQGSTDAYLPLLRKQFGDGWVTLDSPRVR